MTHKLKRGEHLENADLDWEWIIWLLKDWARQFRENETNSVCSEKEKKDNHDSANALEYDILELERFVL